jgi:hypothetical protein
MVDRPDKVGAFDSLDPLAVRFFAGYPRGGEGASSIGVFLGGEFGALSVGEAPGGRFIAGAGSA